MNKIKFLADPSGFDPNISNQINNLKNRTGIVEAGKLLSKDAAGVVQWILGFIMFGGFIYLAVQLNKHEHKKAWKTVGGLVAVAILAFWIVPALS